MPDQPTSTTPPMPELPKEDFKFLMNAIWDSLITIDWSSDKKSPKDNLISFGKAIFAKGSLKMKSDRPMSDDQYREIFPFLKLITNELGYRLSSEAERKLLEHGVDVSAIKNETSQPETDPKVPNTDETSEAPTPQKAEAQST